MGRASRSRSGHGAPVQGSPAVVRMIYPGEGEVLDSSRCRFLIDAPDRRVEIAIDGEGWSSCRRAGDNWWFDWSGLGAGWHQALVRCEEPRRGGELNLTRRFLVAGSPAAKKTDA